MSRSTSRSDARPGRGSRRLRIALGVLLALGVLAVTAWFARAWILERVATSLARSEAGLEVHFAGLELDGISRARIARLDVVARDATGSLRSAWIEDLDVRLDAEMLWDRRVAIESVAARAAHVDLDLRRAPDSTQSGDGEFSLNWPAAWPAVDIAALDADVESAAGRVEVRGARIRVGSRPGAADLDLSARSLRVARAEVTGTAARATLERPLEGPLEVRAELQDETLVVRSARWGSVFDVHAARMTPSADGGFDGSIDVATALGALDLRARSDGRDVRLRGAVAEVDLARLLAVLDIPSTDFGGSWSARGSFVIPFADAAAWTADVQVVAQSPRIAGRSAEAISGRFVASADDFTATQVAVQDGSNEVRADLVRFPRDADIGCEFLERATVELQADLHDVQSILGDAWRIPRDAPPHRVQVRAALADGWVQVESGRAEIGASVLQLAALRLPLDAGPRLVVLDPSTEIELALRSPDSAELTRLILPGDVADALGLEGAVSGSVRLRSGVDGLTARAVLAARGASVRGISIDELALEATFDRGLLTIERLDARAGSTRIAAHGALDVRGKSFSGLEIEADVPELQQLGDALGLEASLPLGRARASARLDGPWTSPQGDLTVDAEDVVVGAVRAAWLRLRAHGADGAIVVDELTALLPLAGTWTANGSLRHEAGGRWTAEVAELELRALEGSAKLARPARLRFGPSGFEFEDVSLAGGEGAVRADGRFTSDDLCVDLEVDSAHVGRVLRAFGAMVPAGLSLDGRATLALHGIANGIGAETVDGDVDLALDLEVPDLSEWDLPRDFHAAGRGHARLEIDGTWRAARGRFSAEARELEVIDATGQTRLSQADLDVRAQLDDAIRIESVTLNLPREARVEVSGRIGTPLDLHALASGTVGSIEDSDVDLRLTVDAPDLAPLGDAFEILRRTAGALTANLRVQGNLGEPNVAGRVELRGGAVKVSATLPAISAVEVDLDLEGDHFVIRRATGAYGGGLVELAGSIDLEGDEPVLDLDVSGRSVPIVRSAEVSVRSDIDVHVEGPWAKLTLTGNAALQDARFEQRLDIERLRAAFASKPGASGGGALELPTIQEAPFATMSVNLDVRSDSSVRVRTPLLRAQVVPRFSIRGTGANPLLDGTIELEGGRIALPASKLDLTRGRADFDPNDPGRARIDITAEGRASGYDVRARVTGTTDDPVIELTSIPPASQEDLALLLLAGRIPGSRGLALDQDRVVGEVASYVARDLAYEWFGDAGESFADRLEFSTGGDVTQSGADTIEVRFRLTGPARGPGKTVYLRGERDVYDRVNMGVRFVLRTQ